MIGWRFLILEEMKLEFENRSKSNKIGMKSIFWFKKLNENVVFI